MNKCSVYIYHSLSLSLYLSISLAAEAVGLIVGLSIFFCVLFCIIIPITVGVLIYCCVACPLKGKFSDTDRPVFKTVVANTPDPPSTTATVVTVCCNLFLDSETFIVCIPFLFNNCLSGGKFAGC